MQDESQSSQRPYQPVKVQVADNTFMIVEALPLQGEANVSDRLEQFKQVAGAIEGVTETLTKVWSKTRPRRASAEFNLAFACDTTRGLLAMFVASSAEASLKITLEWGEPEQPQQR